MFKIYGGSEKNRIQTDTPTQFSYTPHTHTHTRLFSCLSCINKEKCSRSCHQRADTHQLSVAKTPSLSNKSETRETTQYEPVCVCLIHISVSKSTFVFNLILFMTYSLLNQKKNNVYYTKKTQRFLYIYIFIYTHILIKYLMNLFNLFIYIYIYIYIYLHIIVFLVFFSLNLNVRFWRNSI